MSPSDAVKTPREVIERIRTHSFLLDVDSESDMVKEGALNLQRQLNNALQLLSHDLYSKKSHFVLELIQNADDNHYEASVTPHLIFQISQNRLVVINNELGFGEDNIQAICSVGASSKPKSKSGYIGEKGIGFKSVFTVSNAPEIHSNGFHFRFDRTNEENLLGYVVPHWCDPPPNADPAQTTIILPAAKDYRFDKGTFGELDARLLLFLNKLRQLTLNLDGERVTFRRTDDAGISHLLAERESKGRQPSVEESSYVRIELSLSMKGPFTDDKRPDIENSNVVLAFPVDSAGAADPDSTSHVFAFLPIRQMGFRFAIQADFILSSSREEVLNDRPWNKRLRAGIATAFLHAVETFKSSDALAFTFLKYVPAEAEVSDPFFRTVRQEIIELLAKAACLPSASGAWRRPSELRIADKAFRTLFPPKVAAEVFGFDYIDHRVQGGSELIRALGAKNIGLQDVLNVFVAHGPWLQKQPVEWKAEFFAYVANNRLQLVEAGLLKCPCVPLSGGSLAVPGTVSVFYPLSRGKRYGFESELVFVDNELFEAASRKSEHVGALFELLHVKTDDPYDLVNSHILPRHKGDKWKTSDFKALVGHLRYVKDKIEKFLEVAVVRGNTETQAFHFLRDGLWIGTKLITDGSWRFSRAGSLYLSKEYKPDFCIESLLSDAVDLDDLVSSDYLSSKTKDPEAEAESWRNFFARLGVRRSPALTAEGFDWKCSKEMQLLLGSPQAAVRRETLECMSRFWSSYAARLTCTFQQGRSTTTRDTTFSSTLRHTQAPTRKKTPVILSDSFYPTPELKALLGEGLPYVDAALVEPMLDACGITHKLDARALVKRLQQLRLSGSDTAKQLQGIYRALDERLWDSDAPLIRQSFNDFALIRTKGVHQAWSKPSDVSWRSNGPFLDSLYPPLQSQYRDFSRFFLDRLGVPRELPTSKWVDALTRLDTVEEAGNRLTEALAIYRRANRELTPKFGRDEPPRPEWLHVFERAAVYVNQRGELVLNDEHLFANDAPELAALFADHPLISLLAVPTSEVPRLGRLLTASGVKRLSESAVVDVSDTEPGSPDLDLTTRLRGSVQYFARVLYARRNDSFENALDSGKLARLRAFEVVEVPQVNLSVSICGVARSTTTDIAFGESRVLYRSGARSLKDRLATEICRFLGTSVDLADIFARILMEQDASDVEDFLHVRGIGHLPPDLFRSLESPAETHAPETDGHPEEIELLDEVVPDLGDLGPEQEGAKVDPTPSPLTVDRQPATGTPATGGVHSPPTGTSTGTVSGPVAVPGGSGGANLGRTGSIEPAPLEPVEPPVDVHGRGRDHVPLREFGAVRRARRKQTRSPRTKTGRLLSYAANPNSSDHLSADEDPEKAASRDATGRAAVDYFMRTQATRWLSLKEMPHNNPGFDVSAVAHDGTEEFVEVKGQSGAWTEEGVALTPTELLAAHQRRERYWLCVVEYAHDERRRQLYLLQDPFGLTQQFRYDSGWKSTALGFEKRLDRPEKDMLIDMPGVGRGRIVSVRSKGRFFNLHVILEDGRQVNRPFNPAKMTLLAEEAWPE